MCKLFVTDADGSLLDSNNKISEANINAINELREKGVIYTIATGRMFSSILPYALELRVNAPVICFNGALIKDIYTKKVYYYNPIQPDDAIAVIDVLKSSGYQVNLYIDDKLVVEEMNERVEWYLSFNTVEVDAVGDLAEYIKNTGKGTAKIYAIGDIKNPAPVDPEVYDKLSKIVSVSTSGGGHLELNAKGVSKGNALKTLANMYNIKRELVAAVGDNLNDLSMIEYAGFGVAMANAPELVKIKADFVTKSNNEDGIAFAINRIFARQQIIAV
ncbi:MULTISPECIES: Cof-type HAD-IIB family hydrolase [unclassified Thermoanaerobacterium]|uniref:Cof-type HAD-IIB family hydrolase n=1 Tax=unclassified Thermoanaerobacterium TaxID=2622527 RepID=UPI000A153869|nr:MULTISPECIES: Cof-type HAD-IIB family hydrolase [unclassified Thermoanaerobacterium]MDE4542567.1 Cof-type HAD-IIB family hydrolase [Thermoanaerobacterium sp. R66]ORX24554.1 haloacid dehalogenase [Thermoanaerobacterium sp. PSU-2]